MLCNAAAIYSIQYTLEYYISTLKFEVPGLGTWLGITQASNTVYVNKRTFK